MSVTVKVDVAGALAKLSYIGKSIVNLAPVLSGPINQDIDELYKRRFETEGASDGGTKWAPLSPVTKLLRKGRGRGRGKIGRDTNRMWASLTKMGLGPDAIKRVTSTSLERGTKVPYAKFFSDGIRSKTFVVIGLGGQAIPLFRKKIKVIPGRPLLPDPLPSSVTKRWEGMIADFVGGK